MNDVSSEASRIVRCMAVMTAYNGTTTTEVIDNLLSRFSNPIFCNGQARKMVFERITDKTISFKTVPYE